MRLAFQNSTDGAAATIALPPILSATAGQLLSRARYHHHATASQRELIRELLADCPRAAPGDDISAAQLYLCTPSVGIGPTGPGAGGIADNPSPPPLSPMQQLPIRGE